MTDGIEAPAGALHAPHTLRNRHPILDVLRRVLAESRAVLEVGCGSGEQGPWFARRLAHLRWLSADVDPRAVASAAAWRQAESAPNVLPPTVLDATRLPWVLPEAFTPDAVVSINMIHIAPFEACQGLVREAARLLPARGVLYLYGPYRVGGRHTAPSNAVFDQSLRARDPAWGICDLETVVELAAKNGLGHAETIPMPANNLSVVLRKS